MLFAKAHNGKEFPIKARIRYGEDLFPNHCHEEMEIIEILDGNMHVTSGGQQWDLKKGEILMIAPFQCHAITSASPDAVRKVIMVRISVILARSEDQDEMQMMQDALNCRDLYSGDWPTEVREKAAILTDAIYREYTDQHPGWKTAVQSCLGLLLLEAVREMPKTDAVLTTFRYSDEKLREILTYIDHNYTGEISLRACAEHFGYSSGYLSGYFSSRMGISFQEYVKTLRVEKAQWMLITVDLPITKIGNQSGFRDIHTFNRLFKQQCGISPREFRKRAADHREKGNQEA